jgi:hypothetical protein
MKTSGNSSSSVCAEIQAQLPIYLELRQGVLTPAQKEEIKSHVRTCQQCGTHYQTLANSASNAVAYD